MDDVTLADEDGRHFSMRTGIAVRMLFETPFMMFKGWRLMVKVSFHGWLVGTLIESKEPYHAGREHHIEPALVAKDEQGGKDEVMD